MIKKFGLVLALFLSAITVISVPVMASDGAIACVVLSDITVTPGNHYVGDEVTASGTVTITSEAWAGMNSETLAQSMGSFSVTCPCGTEIDSDDQILDVSDESQGNDPDTSASASQVYGWSSTFVLGTVGEYIVQQYGGAYASWYQNPHDNSFAEQYLIGQVIITGLERPQDPPPDGNSGGGEQIPLVESNGGGTASAYVQPTRDAILVILPDARHWFRYEAGRCCVDFNDGTWRVVIPEGTRVRCSCERATRLIVDSDGNITSNVVFIYSGDEEVQITRM